VSEPIPEVYGRNKLIAFLKKYLLGEAPGHRPRIPAIVGNVAVTGQITGLLAADDLELVESQTIERAISFCDITVAADVTLTIESGGLLVVKDVNDF
jgi:hypothetical protein